MVGKSCDILSSVSTDMLLSRVLSNIGASYQRQVCKFEVAIRTAPVSEHLFAIRTAMLTHMRSEAMFNLCITALVF